MGVLTISAEALTPAHLLAAGVAPTRLADVVVQGVDAHGHFASAILGNQPQMDLQRAASEVVAAARALHRRAPQLDTLVLECTKPAALCGGHRGGHGLALPLAAGRPAAAGRHQFIICCGSQVTRPGNR